MIIYKLGKDKKTGEIVSIQNASKGLSCGCVCPDCGKEFIAAQGHKNEWHFRHYEETDCKGGQETALHLLAKKIIVENSLINLPIYGKVEYDNPVLEKYFNTIQPDVTVEINGHKLFFEISVTHPVDHVKEIFYKQNEYKSVEIDLKNFSFMSVENLKNEILTKIETKRIIFWEKKKSTSTSSDNYFLVFFFFIIALFVRIWWRSKQRDKRK